MSVKLGNNICITVGRHFSSTTVCAEYRLCLAISFNADKACNFELCGFSVKHWIIGDNNPITKRKKKNVLLPI